MVKINVFKRIKIVSVILLITIFAQMFTLMGAYAEETSQTEKTDTMVEFEAGDLKYQDIEPTIKFGSHKISESEEIYSAIEAITKEIQVSDLRGNAKGWKLTAKLSAFRLGDKDTGPLTLKGAIIAISEQNIYSPKNSLSTAPVKDKPIISLESGGNSVIIMTAKAGGGMGVWNSKWDHKNVSLTVKPGTAQAGTSYAVIDYTLEAAP